MQYPKNTKFHHRDIERNEIAKITQKKIYLLQNLVHQLKEQVPSQ